MSTTLQAFHSNPLPCPVIPPPLHQLPRTRSQEALDNQSRGRLTLDQKFFLAHRLASSVYELHLVKWLHRRISASNVVFFHPNTTVASASPSTTPAPNTDPVIRPASMDPTHSYLLGFASSREDLPTDQTDGASTSPSRTHYQHPQYQSGTKGFQAGFDWYALGMVLLEVGLGKTYPDVCKEMGLRGKGARNGKSGEVAEQVLVELEYTMGRRYREIVERCLGVGIGWEDGQDRSGNGWKEVL